MLGVWTKIKSWFAVIVTAFIAGAGIVWAFFKGIATRKERNYLRKTVKRQNEYSKKREEIENETNEKINKLNADATTSFDASVELLHEASNADD